MSVPEAIATTRPDDPFGERFVTGRHTIRQGGSWPISLLRVEARANEIAVPASANTVFALIVKADSPLRWRGPDGAIDEWIRVGEIAVCPDRSPLACESDGAYEIAIMFVPSVALRTLLPRCSTDRLPVDIGAIDRRAVIRDPGIRKIILQLWAECAQADPAAALLIDGLTQVMLGQLLRYMSKPPEAGVRRFDAATLARIDEYVHAHLDRRIGVEDLAQLTGLSRFRFSRAFSATTGLSPYQHVTQLRAECARRRIEAGREPLVDIALACGYASQSHMNEAFRRYLGTTPGQCRKA